MFNEKEKICDDKNNKNNTISKIESKVKKEKRQTLRKKLLPIKKQQNVSSHNNPQDQRRLSETFKLENLV